MGRETAQAGRSAPKLSFPNRVLPAGRIRPRMAALLIAFIAVASAASAGVVWVAPGLSVGTHPISTALPSTATPATNPAVPPTSGLPGTNPTSVISLPPDFRPTGFLAPPPPSPNSNSTGSSTLPPATAPAPSNSETGAGIHPLAAPGGVTVTGTVLAQPPPQLPISGATVTVETVGQACTPGCPSVTTGDTGTFTVANVDPGTILVTVQAGDNLTNYTTLFGVTAGSVSAGTIYLVPDAIVSGCIKGADPTHEAVSGVAISGVTRDGSLQAVPDFFSGSNGCFNTPGVAVPPGPSVIDFTPPEGSEYLKNDTYVDLAPGQHFRLPYTVYLSVGVTVSVNLWDSVSKRQITGGQGYVALTVTSRSTGVSFGQGEAVPIGETPSAYAPPGNDTLTVDMDGFLENSSPVSVPTLPPGHTVRLGTVWLVPDGAISSSTGFTWPTAVKQSDWYGDVGLVVVTVCSLDGFLPAYSISSDYNGVTMTSSTCLTSCQPEGASFEVNAPPLRTRIAIAPDQGTCQPGDPTWPTNLMFPVVGNDSFANVTAGSATTVPAIDFTPGTYVEGMVEPGNNWTITACSTDEVSICMPSSGPINTRGLDGPCTDGDQGSLGYCPYDPEHCPEPSTAHAGETFCMAVPPGPDQFSVSSLDQGDNITWAEIAPGSFGGPLQLSAVSSNHITSINLSAGQGEVSGVLEDSVTGLPIPNWFTPHVSASPAGQLPWGGGTGFASNGFFNVSVTSGWLSIVGTASDYLSNGTWVFINNSGSMVPLGTVNLTPVAWVQGQIFDANGTPIVYADVQTCDIDLTNCQPVLSNGITGTSGQYSAKVAAGRGTVGTYLVEASAPGYITNFTWINVTDPGGVYTVPPINLTPFLSVHTRGLQPAGGSTPAPDPYEYLVGTILDNTSGLGVPLATIALTPVGGGFSSNLAGSITDGGDFNYTVTTGQFWANITAPNYYPQSFFVNISGLIPQLSLGTVLLEPFTGYVTGQLSIAPWASITSTDGVGPGAVQISVCLAAATSVCGVGSADVSGFFNVSAPWGYHDSVYISPDGGVPGGVGSAPFGFLNATSNANVVNASNRTFVRTGLTIFGVITGDVRDDSTANTTPVRYGSFSLATLSNRTGVPAGASETLTGGGGFTVFVPPGRVAGVALGSAYVPYNFTSPVNLPNVTSPNVTTFGPISLQHFGWITGHVRSSVVPQGGWNDWVPAAGVSTQSYDPTSRLSLTGQTSSDDTGYFNVTAPPFRGVELTILAPDFNQTGAFDLTVNQSRTLVLNSTSLPAAVPWGWVAGDVIDPTLLRAVVGASPTVVDSGTGTLQSKTGVFASETGEFLTDAVPGPTDLMTVQAATFLTNTSVVNVTPGNVTTVDPVRLTATGVVAGNVFGLPANITLGGAQVSVCGLSSPQCSNFTTTANQAGVFWASAPPGTDRINASFANYAPNVSIVVTVAPDSWQWVGSVLLSEYATLTGTILGLPSGLPVVHANASLCSAVVFPGEPTGPCGLTVESDAVGGFTMSVPAGTYILALDAGGYAPTYLPISIRPGEQVNLGTFLLEQDGVLQGFVVGSDTDSPVVGTQVFGCSTQGDGGCTGTVGTNSTGGFSVDAMPGLYVLTATAPGYQDSDLPVRAQSGATTIVGLILLVPVGSNQLFAVSGTIVGSNSSAPIAGATVISAGGYASQPSASDGAFTIYVPWGTYDLVARAAGYDAASLTVAVHDNVTGIDFSLYPSAFTLSGEVRDGLTNDVLDGVELQLTLTQSALASTDADGHYAVLLSNGTYAVTVLSPEGAVYEPLAFVVTINGANVQRNVTLFPPSTSIDALTVDASSGLPVANATVTFGGTTSTGIPWTTTLHSTPLGTISLTIYAGTYVVQVNASGFTGLNQDLVPHGASQQIILTLTPTAPTLPATTSTPSPPAGDAEWAYGAAIAIAAIALGGIFLATRRSPRKGGAA
ncbi:MAG: carboxypeptidase regulatory-like domain-containing protein [Thermoplasmata archaeon]|nr:carboxypeptidase regulatory-like domain-containing protein [Thermoplasmata archaeon]